MARKWVFAVHKWETADGKHHVSYGTGRRYRTKSFSKWSNAREFAEKKAADMGLRKYQIDTPTHPHTMLKVQKTTKKTKRSQIPKKGKTPQRRRRTTKRQPTLMQMLKRM